MNLTITKKFEIDIIKDICQVLFGALFLGLFAKIYIPLFFSPVPIILQNSIALSYGYFFSAKKGALSVLLFIALAILGLPFFASGPGLTVIMSTNGGYFFSFALASFFVGKMFQRLESKNSKNIAFIILSGHLIVLLGGFLWFSFFVGLKQAFLLGVVPFIAVDIFKSIVITKMIKLKSDYF